MKKMSKAASTLISGYLVLIISPQAKAQAIPDEILGSRALEQLPLVHLRESTYGFSFGDNELTFYDGTPALVNNIPAGLGLGTDSCAAEGQDLPEGLTEATGWVSNGDGTVNFTGEVDRTGQTDARNCK